MTHLRLYDDHVQRGASFMEQQGWNVPAHYGDAVAEHHAVQRTVGIMDLSHRGKILVTGDDRVKWLQRIISNDILPLTTGEGVYSGFLTHKGHMLSYFRVYQLGASLLLEDVGEIGDRTFLALRKFLLYGTKATMEPCADNWGHLLVSGPQACGLIKAVCAVDMASLKLLSFLSVEMAGDRALLIRSEETGRCDVSLLIPANGLKAVWDRLWAVGETMGLTPFGAQALETLRMEAGIPKAGSDLNEQIVPPEANLEGKAFSLAKGCYPGQEVVARMDTYGSVRRRLVGLTVDGAVPPPHGAKLFSDAREVGWVSSAVRSPSLGTVIALGFPLRDFTAPGTSLSVEAHGARKAATVQTLPFVSP